MGIDPGIAGSGWAILQTSPLALLESGVIRGFKDDDWENKGFYIANKLSTIRSDYSLSSICIEYPSFFQSAHGEMVARKGDLVKLAWFIGVLNATLKGSELVPVEIWKGQLPKEVVNKRIVTILGKQKTYKLKSHDWDATGIALFKAGKF